MQCVTIRLRGRYGEAFISAVEKLYADIEAERWTTEIEVPVPPSVNTFTRKLGNRSHPVVKWCRQADMHFVMARQHLIAVKGRFEVDITYSRSRMGAGADLDNRIKPLLDWLERVRLIENDKLCEKITAQWGATLVGCRVRIRPWGSS